MTKQKTRDAAASGRRQGGDDRAVIDLRMDSTNPEAPRDVLPVDSDGFQTPCSLTGVMAGLSGGSLGYVFGFGEGGRRWARGTRQAPQALWAANGTRPAGLQP